MRKAKDIALVGVCVALLIGGQMALQSVAGVELVTVMLLCFAYALGAVPGVSAAVVFSLLRCFIFGFQLHIILLYLLYYPLFALFFGWLGIRLREKKDGVKLIICVVSAVVFTAGFTLLDDVLTPLICGFPPRATELYFYASLPTMATQGLCTVVTVSVFFAPLTRLLQKVK